MKKLNKTEFQFFKHKDNGRIYMQVLTTTNGLTIFKNMLGNDEHISITESDFSNYIAIDEDQVYIETKNMSNSDYDKFMGNVGAYTCPFCGGRLNWESDFMTSEVRGLEHGYYKVTDEDEIERLQKQKDEFIRGNIMGTTDKTIEELNHDVWNKGDYPYMYLYIGEDFYAIDDPVIGIYECGNCHKRYEIQDAYEHDWDEDDSEDNYYE